MTTFAQNRKVTFNYEILEKIEGGLSLFGHEVKSIKQGKVSLVGSYIIIRGNEAFLVGATISPYQANNIPKNYDPERTRKVLLKKREIQKLINWEKQRGLTLIPLSLYNSRDKIKVEIAVARGKKKTDKRQTLKKREAQRDIERTLKYRR